MHEYTLKIIMGFWKSLDYMLERDEIIDVKLSLLRNKDQHKLCSFLLYVLIRYEDQVPDS